MILLKKFRYLPAVALMVLAFTSCDDDFNTIGGELVGGQLDAFPRYEAGVVAYNKKLSAVQTNNLPLQLLGIYNEPVYGQQQANVLAQLSLSANNPGFGNEPRLDSVITQEIAAPSEAPGAANLFLRGGEGSMAVIELFKDEAELEELRAKNWLQDQSRSENTLNGK